MQTLFAKSLNDRLINGLRSELQREEILSDFLYEFMQKSKREPKAAGFISIIGKEDDYEFWFGHTTESMGYGYMFESDDRAFAEVSRKNVYSPFCLSCLPIN